jgi:hypothetical protein
MPHLIDTYSTASGFTIDSPFIYESYFPIPFEKYILFHTGSNQPAKNYDYFPEVATMARDTLRKNGYELIQIGGANDPLIMNAIDLRGKTNIHQTAYLIKRASLLVGTDSCNVHFASGFNTPLIALYGSTCPRNHGPYFGDKEKQIIIEADRKGKMPSFNANESPKTINNIKPEIVVQKIYDLLKIDEKTNVETIFIGNQYNSFVMEVILDSVIKPDFFQGSVLNVRMDYLFNEEILAKNLAFRPLCILTNKPINIDILRRYRQNVALVIYNLENDYSIEFVKQMLESGIPYQLISFLEKGALDQAKLDFFDYGIILNRERMTKEKLLEKQEKDIKIDNETKFKTHKFLLSDNKTYLTKKDWMEKKPVSDFTQNAGTAQLDDPDFLEMLDFVYLFNEN